MDMKEFLRDRMRALGKDNYQKFLRVELIRKWAKIVDKTIADKVRPVTIEHNILFVDVSNSAFKDQLKFHNEEIIEAINDIYGQDEPIINEVRIASGFQIAENPPPKGIDTPEEISKPTLEQMTLTDEEVKQCEEQASRISDENFRQTVLDTLLSRARLKKFRLSNGWHKCDTCDVLCPPEENFCEVCLIKQRKIMVAALYKIIYDTPWLNARDVQTKLLEKLPKLRSECSFDAIESARTSLIQKIAGAIRYGDEESDEVFKLVMLEKRLRREDLTPAIIRRTLLDLQFNLADQALLFRYNTRSKRRNK